MTSQTSDAGTAVSGRTSPPAVRTVMRQAATTVEASAHLAAAAYLMKRSGSTALVVTSDDAKRPLAVLTETDVSRAVADGRNVEETRIRDLASPPITVEPQIAVDEAARLMLLRRIHHLPVVEGGRLVGIVDMADLCRALLDPQDASAE